MLTLRVRLLIFGRRRRI